MRTLLLLAPLCLTSLAEAAEIPKVALSEQHRAMCAVGVGDALPKLTLVTPNGDPQALAPLFGKSATVVAFYQEPADDKAGWMTQALLTDLEPDVAKRYASAGVQTIAVRVGGKAQPIKGLLALSDPEGEAFAQVGKGRTPRVLVLDAKGKILWFDLEYSHSTRRELRQTLQAITGPAAVAQKPN